MNGHIQGQLGDSCSVVRVLSFTLSAFVELNWGGGAQANLILMLFFVYFIMISFFLSAEGGQGGVGFDVATGEVCVLDPRDICCGSEGWEGVLTNQR